MTTYSKNIVTSVILLATWLWITCNIGIVYALYQDFYQDCVKGYEFDDSITSAVVLSPIYRVCQKRCETECNGFSRQIKTSKDDIPGVELNASVIQRCMTACQNGVRFSSTYYQAKPRASVTDNIELEVRGPSSIGTACFEAREQLQNTAMRTNLEVKDGDQISILVTGTEGNSKIYLCGKKNITLTPIIPNVKDKNSKLDVPVDDNNSWYNTKNPPAAWQKQSNNICLQKISPSEWTGLTNYKLWHDKYKGDDICSWHARNPNYVRTGIYISDNDELRIAWSGDYAYTRNPSGGFLYDREQLINCIRNSSISQEASAYCSNMFYNATSLLIKNHSGAPYQLSGEKARPPSIPIGLQSTPTREMYECKWHGGAIQCNWVSLNDSMANSRGLLGSYTDNNLRIEINKAVPGCVDSTGKPKPEAYSTNSCIKITNYGTSSYAYQGLVKGFGEKKSELALRHFEDTGDSAYSSHYGGYEVHIDWGGCPFADGSHIQYAVFPELNVDPSLTPYSHLPQIPENKWKDIPTAVLQPGKFLEISGGSGRLFLRIKPEQAPEGSPPEVIDLYENPANRFGQYYLIVQKHSQNSMIVTDGQLTKLVRLISDIVLGKNRTPGSVTESGVVYKMYHYLVSNQRLTNMVRAIILMYIAFLAIGFIMGIIEVQQQDIIIRLIKIGIVLTVISPDSWSFFGGYLVPLCIDGTLELIARVISNSYPLEVSKINESQLLQDPIYIFQILDGPLRIMWFSTPIWKKILALICNSLFGIVIAVIIIVAMIFYTITIFKATVMYIFSVVVTALLLIMGPIFIPMVLFKQTKELFDAWVKQLISFVLQPVMVFTSIALFHLLLFSLLHACFNFTACPRCFINIDFTPLFQICLGTAYYPLLNVHLPIGTGGGLTEPATAIGLALSFLLIAHGSYAFSTFITSIASRIVTGSPIRQATIAAPADKAEIALPKGIQSFAYETASIIRTAAGDASAAAASRRDISTSSDKDSASSDKDSASSDKDSASSDKDSTSSDKDSTSSDKDSTSSESSGANSTRGGLDTASK